MTNMLIMITALEDGGRGAAMNAMKGMRPIPPGIRYTYQHYICTTIKHSVIDSDSGMMVHFIFYTNTNNEMNSIKFEDQQVKNMCINVIMGTSRFCNLIGVCSGKCGVFFTSISLPSQRKLYFNKK